MGSQTSGFPFFGSYRGPGLILETAELTVADWPQKLVIILSLQKALSGNESKP